MAGAPDRPVDLNSASKEELMRVRGISERRALQILRYRDEHGGFHSVDELRCIQGFADLLDDDFRDALTAGRR
jgi:competence protein ComEA